MRTALSRVLLLFTVAWLAPALSAAPASAHDAPMAATARHGLLPDEPWVKAHWAPFDEQLLVRELRIPLGQLEAFLYNDHHTIAQLARHRRVGFSGLVRRLSAWSDDVAGADRAEIERRIRLVLVSGHLAQHVFHHVFHGLALTPTIRRDAHVSLATFTQRREQAWSYRRIVAAGGGTPDATESALTAKIATNQDHGVATFQAPPSEAARLAARQQARLHCWFIRPAQELDPAAPYDRDYTKGPKGHTSVDVPTTRKQQHREDRRVARGLATLPRGCWSHPQRLRIDPGPPLSRRRLRVLGGVPTGYHGRVNDGASHHHVHAAVGRSRR